MNTRKIQKMYFETFYCLKRWMIQKNVRRMIGSYCDPAFKLTKEQEKQVKDFYGAYIKDMPMLFHEFYTQKTGIFSPYYLPMDIYLNNVDEYFNDRTESKYMDNKCYYPTLFKGIPQPEAVVLRIGGLWYSSDMELISEEKMKELISAEPEFFAKQATASYGGKGVVHVSAEKGDVYKQFEEFLSYAKSDIIVQKPVRQHKDISAIHENSVNTMRIISLLSKDGVKVYSAILRVGVGGNKVDNASQGGVTCGITEDGKLKKGCYRLNGDHFDVHPTNNFDFEGYQIPSFDKAIELVKKAHPMVPHFKLVSWDVAITEDGTPVMIEANLAKGSSEFHQYNNGPLFGEDTKKILDEVFGKK